MIEQEGTRLEWLAGAEAVDKGRQASVAVFGCGGVGSFVIEALVRSGIGRVVIIDGDEVTKSNINRQLIATQDTVGQRKVAVTAARARSIRPDVTVEAYDLVYTKASHPDFIESLGVDAVVDAIDMVTAKLDIIMECQRLGIHCISSMGTGNKVHGDRFKIVDIHKTHTCPLAKVMRRELKKRGVKKQLVLFSDEQPRTPDRGDFDSRSPGSCGFVPSVAGLLLAGHIIRRIWEVD